MTSVIAIDGVAGSGKSTTASLLAKRINYTHLNSGALYRIVAFIHINMFGDREPEVSSSQRALESANISTDLSGAGILRWQLDGEAVDHLISGEEVGKVASKIAVFENVRAYVNEILRTLASRLEHVVVEGRDIGTVVFPDAGLKIFLTASAEVRARRRQNENRSGSVAKVQQELLDRDKRDSSRKADPLVAADDAITIDTSSHTPDQVVGQIVDLL